MNTKKVEIEIPADMDVKLVRPYRNINGGIYNNDLVVELIKQQPRRWTFEEIVGKREVNLGDICFEPTLHMFNIAKYSYVLADNWIAVRKVEDVNT